MVDRRRICSMRRRAWNLIERFFDKTKQCRPIATRYGKLAANYLAETPRRPNPLTNEIAAPDIEAASKASAESAV